MIRNDAAYYVVGQRAEALFCKVVAEGMLQRSRQMNDERTSSRLQGSDPVEAIRRIN